MPKAVAFISCIRSFADVWRAARLEIQVQMVSMFFIGLWPEHSRKPVAGGLMDSAQELGLRRRRGTTTEAKLAALVSLDEVTFKVGCWPQWSEWFLLQQDQPPSDF